MISLMVNHLPSRWWFTNGRSFLLNNAGIDDQQLDSIRFNDQSNALTIYLQDGGSQTVDLSYLNNAGSDGNNWTLSDLTISLMP